MSETKNLCENSRIVGTKATEKLHVHHVLAAILGETPELCEPIAHFVPIL